MSAIRQVYELFQDKSKWTTGEFARDNSGYSMSFDSPDAVCWCLHGALDKYASNPRDFIKLRSIQKQLYPDANSLACLNDRYGYDAVMKVLETALAEEQ
jgi:hypothetical protein